MDNEPDPIEHPIDKPDHRNVTGSGYTGSGKKPDNSGFFLNNKAPARERYSYRHPSQEASAKTRGGLESVGLSYDHLIDVAEDYDFLPSDSGLESRHDVAFLYVISECFIVLESPGVSPPVS